MKESKRLAQERLAVSRRFFLGLGAAGVAARSENADRPQAQKEKGRSEMTTEERLDKLEKKPNRTKRRNRWGDAVALGLIGGAMALILASAAKQGKENRLLPPDQFVLENEDGKFCAGLFACQEELRLVWQGKIEEPYGTKKLYKKDGETPCALLRMTVNGLELFLFADFAGEIEESYAARSRVNRRVKYPPVGRIVEYQDGEFRIWFSGIIRTETGIVYPRWVLTPNGKWVISEAQ